MVRGLYRRYPDVLEGRLAFLAFVGVSHGKEGGYIDRQGLVHLLRIRQEGGRMKDFQAATDRLFRDYFRHCQAPNEDTLFHFLNSLHSFSDKLTRHKKRGLLDSPNFVGLKALRNLFHHEAELLSKISIVTDFVQPVVVELMRVCLVERSLVERAAAAEARQATRQKREPSDVAGAFNWYGEIADIEPAIFNVVVDAYEVIRELDVAPSSDEFQMFEVSYEDEEKRGFDRRVAGHISCHAGNVDGLLRKMHAR